MWLLCTECRDVRFKKLEELEAHELLTSNGPSSSRRKRGSTRSSEGKSDTSCCANHAADVRTLGEPRGKGSCAWLAKSYIDAKKREYEKQNGLKPGSAINGKHIHIPEHCYDCKGLIPMAFGMTVKDSNKLCEEEMRQP